jgi:pimeloyl-ACP methyl ester carboxylesterase
MMMQTLKLLRPFVKLASAIVPSATAEAAFKLFCRPPRQKDGAALQRHTERAQRLFDHAERWQIPFDEDTLSAYHFSSGTQTKKPVLLVHGWTGRAYFMAAFVKPLLEAGHDIVAVDLPGHGESSGRKLNVPLGVGALQAMERQFGPFHGIIAHSFGGAVSTAFARGDVAGSKPGQVARLVLISTPHSMLILFRWFGEMIGLAGKAQARFEGIVQRLTGRDLSTFEGDAQLREANIPTLILHAPDDKEVPFKGAEIMAQAGPHVQLKSLPGLGHRRIIAANETVQSTVAFLTSR